MVGDSDIAVVCDALGAVVDVAVSVAPPRLSAGLISGSEEVLR